MMSSSIHPDALPTPLAKPLSFADPAIITEALSHCEDASDVETVINAFSSAESDRLEAFNPVAQPPRPPTNFWDACRSLFDLLQTLAALSTVIAVFWIIFR